jgi:hypothetical protein
MPGRTCGRCEWTETAYLFPLFSGKCKRHILSRFSAQDVASAGKEGQEPTA